MKTVYIETSVVSYLTALPTRDLLVAAWIICLPGTVVISTTPR